MPTKTLYQVLEVSETASVETIEAAYRAISERLKQRAARDPQGAALMVTALEEAYRTLSNNDLRRRYDARIAPQPSIPAASTVDDRPWIVRNWVVMLLLAFATVSAYGYHRHIQKEKAAIAKALREKEELVAKQKAEQEERERLQAEAQDARRKQLEEARYRQWVEQNRRIGTAYAREEERQRARIQQDAIRQEQAWARQQRMEEMAKQREEMQARARLEQDKRKLEQLERENHGYRRY
jgi:curved DNA-binding protein CbpA